MAKRNTRCERRDTSDAERTDRRRKIMACERHPDRIAATDVHGKKCWECYLGRIPFMHRFHCTPEVFYARSANRVNLNEKHKS